MSGHRIRVPLGELDVDFAGLLQEPALKEGGRYVRVAHLPLQLGAKETDHVVGDEVGGRRFGGILAGFSIQMSSKDPPGFELGFLQGVLAFVCQDKTRWQHLGWDTSLPSGTGRRAWFST